MMSEGVVYARHTLEIGALTVTDAVSCMYVSSEGERQAFCRGGSTVSLGLAGRGGDRVQFDAQPADQLAETHPG